MERRTNYLSRPYFQIKFTLILGVVASITSIIVGGICYLTVRKIYFQFINAHYNISHEQLQQLQNQITNTGIALALTLFVFSIALVIFGIFLTHRVAGPMTKMVLIMDRIMNGEKIEKVAFRKNDEFQDVAHKFTEFLEFQSHNHAQDPRKKEAS